MNINSSISKRILLGALATSAVAATVAVAPVSAGPETNPVSSPLAKGEVQQIRTATARFHDVENALAAGYVPTETCTAAPGLGGMGYHYANPANISDGVIDPTKPEILLYHVDDDGHLKLGGVEYFAPDADQNLSTDADRPNLFGQPFDGPMPGHELGMPVHYDLHVWLHTKNPAGLLAAWNPDVDCPTGPAEHHHD
jgi:hypothetical protein